MIYSNTKYYNKNNTKDIITVVNIEYDEGLKKVFFTRSSKDSRFALPIEMFEKNFVKVDGN